jgi:hypothetical protein
MFARSPLCLCEAAGTANVAGMGVLHDAWDATAAIASDPVAILVPLSPVDKHSGRMFAVSCPKPLVLAHMGQKRRTTAASPPTTPTATTPTLTATSSRRLKERPTIASEGTLIGGSAINNTPAGPTPTPSDSIA